MMQPPSFQICTPDPTSDAWAAINATLTLVGIGLTTIIAWVAYRISKQILLTEETPIVLLAKARGYATVTNVGRGTALATYVMGPDRDEVIDGGILPPGEQNELTTSRAGRLSFDGYRSNHVFYQSLSGRWWYSIASANLSFKPAPADVTCAHRMRRVSWYRVHPIVKKSARARARSIEGHLEVNASPITREGFVLRADRLWVRTRLHFWRAVSGIGEPARVRRLQPLAVSDPPTADATEREGWELQVSGPFYCWHTSGSTIRQYSCRVDGDRIICDVGLDRLGGGLVRGVLVVSRDTFERAGLDRHTRSETIFKKLNEYLCKRSPREFFACEIT